MIVKVQLSLFTDEKTSQMLLYNRKRDIFYQGEAIKPVLKLMGKSVRKYFNARFDKATGNVELLNEVNDQLW